MLRFDDGRPFAHGASTFSYRPATEQDRTPRIFVGVQIEGLPVEAVVDTGGVYLMCDPEIAGLLGLNPNSGLGSDMLWIRGVRVHGRLHRVFLKLLASRGHSLELQVTAFVPCLQANQQWNLPSFLGLMGCLERLRFAVDPTTDEFYFGPIDEGR